MQHGHSSCPAPGLCTLLLLIVLLVHFTQQPNSTKPSHLSSEKTKNRNVKNKELISEHEQINGFSAEGIPHSSVGFIRNDNIQTDGEAPPWEKEGLYVDQSEIVRRKISQNSFYKSEIVSFCDLTKQLIYYNKYSDKCNNFKKINNCMNVNDNVNHHNNR